MHEREAHPTRVEFVVERDIGDGRWVVESISPLPTAEEAEEAERGVSWRMRSEDTYRTVRRTITSTVVAVHPTPAPSDPGSGG